MQTTTKITIERITPTKAEQMLNRNKSNRKLREGLAEAYASDMKEGKWTECPMPIVFYDDGDVADGQHRLWAIIMSNTTQTFTVHRGLSREAGLNIDTGLGRTLVDNARISGANSDLSNRLLAVTRAVGSGSRWSNSAVKVTAAQRLAMVDEYGEAARWALANAPKGRAFSHALVLGALARAWYYEEDKGRLARFSEVLTKGFMSEDGDGAAVALRNYLLASTGFGRPDVWRDAFYKTQHAIHHFMRRRKLTFIRTVAAEAYPLPTATKRKKAA